MSSPEEGILKKWIAVGMVAAFAACSDGTVTGPDPVDEQVVVAAPVPEATPVPTPTPEVRVQFWEGGILPNAGWDVKNIGPQTESWTAYYTSFDNQSLALGSQQTTINRGDSFRGSFNKTCVQVDVTQGGPGDTPFLAGFIDHNGRVVRANQIDREACKPVIRVPDPEPTDPPSSCEPTFTERTVSEYNYGDWDKVGFSGEKCGKRYYDVVKYTLNSCTEQETNTVLESHKKDELECSKEPEIGLCHVEAQQGSNAGGYCTWSSDIQPGSNVTPGWDCQNSSDNTHSLLLYQCQNKKEKANGHDNHNLDYLGNCVLATQTVYTGHAICYNINGTPN